MALLVGNVADGRRTELHTDRSFTTKFTVTSHRACHAFKVHPLLPPVYVSSSVTAGRPPVYTPRGLGEVLGIYATSSTAGNPFIHEPSPPERYPPCPHRILRPCNDSVALTGLHLTSTINLAMYSSVKSTGDLCQIFEAMIWCRSLTI